MLLAEYGLDKYVVNMHAMAYDQSPGQHSTYDLAQKVARQGVSLLPSTSHHRIHLVYHSMDDMYILGNGNRTKILYNNYLHPGPNKMRYMGTITMVLN